MSRPKKMKDKNATALDWFFVDLFGKELFGTHYEINRPGKIIKKQIHELINGNKTVTAASR